MQQLIHFTSKIIGEGELTVKNKVNISGWIIKNLTHGSLALSKMFEYGEITQ
jgi:hypothetical protein